MELKQRVQIATKMRRNKSLLLDVTKLTAEDAHFITTLLKNTALYNFFVKVQDIPIKKIYVVCKYFEYKDALEELGIIE